MTAQDRLFIGSLGFENGVLVAHAQEVGTSAPFGQTIGPVPAWATGQLAGGGRFVVERAGGLTATILGGPPVFVPPIVREVVTDAIVALPQGRVVAVDPIRPRVFVLVGTDLVLADLATGASVSLTNAMTYPIDYGIGGIVQTPPEFRYAQNADRVFVRRGNAAATAPELVAMDARAGASVQQVPDLGGPFASWLVDPAAARLFVLNGSTMVVRHPDTGVVLGSTPVSVFAGASLIPDWVHDRIFALYGNPRAWVISAVTGSGQLVGEAVQGGNCRPDIRVSAATGRIYVLQYGPGNGSYYGPIEQQLTAFDGATLQPLDDVHVTDFSSCDVGSLGVAAPPGAPARLAASLSGHDVTLSWTNVGDASGFVVDVGLAPGQTVVSVPVGLASSVTFGSAPPGLYFVRVRGSNLFGNSRPSNEVTIIVP